MDSKRFFSRRARAITRYDAYMRAQITVSPSESKRLVAKGVANLESVKRALTNGIIILSRSTTNAYVYEELTGRKIGPDGYCCGVITTYGTCVGKHVFDRSYQTLVVLNGEPVQISAPQELPELINRMESEDVFIKSANVLDPSGAAATIVGDPTGGEVGELEVIRAKKAKLIVPVTINKTIPISIEKAMKACGIEGTEKSMGMPVSLLPLPGLVMTELETIRLLAGATAVPIAALDAEGRGTTTLSINGSTEQVETAWRLVSEIKGEKPIIVERISCSACPASTCSLSGLRMR